jgi:transcriptional regulator
MYTPPPFKSGRTAALAFAAARGFGTIVAWDGRKPVASAVPFCLDYGNDGTPHVALHLARNNPLLALAGDAASWLLAVNGPDAYVSPDFYASADQVPTWLYQAVHLSGPVQVMADDALGPHLDALSGKFEDWLAPKPPNSFKIPWTTAKMTPGRLEAMKKAIVGLVMVVDEVEGSFKLNQHKSDSDFGAVAAALSVRPDAGAKLIAGEMRALRPQLFADYVTHINAMPSWKERCDEPA